MIIETISAIAILGIAILFLNPGDLTMPYSMVSMLIVGLIVSFLTSRFLLFFSERNHLMNGNQYIFLQQEEFHILSVSVL